MSKPTEPGWYWHEKPGLDREISLFPDVSDRLRRQIEAEYRRVVYVDFDNPNGGDAVLCGKFPGGYVPVTWMDKNGIFGPRIEEWKP